jgi:hypothetical protein
MGSVCRVEWSRSRNSVKDVRKSEMIRNQLQKCLRQQSKRLLCSGFRCADKRWDKGISVGGGCVEKTLFFSRFEYHIFYVLYPFVIYSLTLPRSSVVGSYHGLFNFLKVLTRAFLPARKTIKNILESFVGVS